jgi:membrane associated rhomboid family serine protease
MTPTPVGMRCPECARQRTKVMRMREMRTVPRVTYALIAVNVLVFLTEEGQFSLFGSAIHGPVIEKGWLDRYDVHVNDQYWRLISSAFLHENFLHIGFNMYLLYLLGNMLEPAIGSVRFALIYFTALLAGTAAGTVLVVLRTRRRSGGEISRTGFAGSARGAAERAFRDLSRETRKQLARRGLT